MANKDILAYDFCVIGGDTGGLEFAAEAAQMGASVVLVKISGTDESLHSAHMHSKSFLSAAKTAKYITEAPLFGWKIDNSAIDFEIIKFYLKSVEDTISQHHSKERFESLGVKIIDEDGRFVDDSTFVTEGHVIQAKIFVLATGSHSFIPAIPGLDHVPYYTNETVFSLKELPKHLVIIGGGPIGIEMAQAFRRLGSQVTVLEMLFILPRDEPEIVHYLKEILIEEGVVINEHLTIDSVEQTADGIKIEYTMNHVKASVIASHVLVTAGRRPNIQSLNLNAARVKCSERGVSVDECLMTTNHKIYALGSCVGGYQFTHVADHQVHIMLKNTIFHLRTPFDGYAIPWVTYTDPELAHVGQHAFQLRNEKIPHKVHRILFENNDRAVLERAPQGEIKIMLNPYGVVLGATILGRNAGELIYPWAMMVQNRLHITKMANTMAAYPTLSNLSKQIAERFHDKKSAGSMTQKIVHWLMKFRF